MKVIQYSKIIQYKGVKRATLSELNSLGEDGWIPAALVFEEDQYTSGWTGILWREVNSDDTDTL